MEILSAKEAAQYLGNLSLSFIYKASSSGSIPKLKHSGRVMFLRSDLDEYILSHRKDCSPKRQIKGGM